jgi:hypothetical protein
LPQASPARDNEADQRKFSGCGAPEIIFLKCTQVFDEPYAPNTTFASLPYSFPDFVDFSTIKENSFASYAFFNFDPFNRGNNHSVRTFRALDVSLIWRFHSDLIGQPI